MFSLLLVVSVMFGCLAAWMGSRTALALLAGAGVQEALAVAGVPFFAPWWMLVDGAVIIAICLAARRFGLRQSAVILLFVPAWGFYFVDGWPGYDGTALATSLQFLLTVPWSRLLGRAREAAYLLGPFDGFDLRVSDAR